MKMCMQELFVIILSVIGKNEWIMNSKQFKHVHLFKFMLFCWPEYNFTQKFTMFKIEHKVHVWVIHCFHVQYPTWIWHWLCHELWKWFISYYASCSWCQRQKIWIIDVKVSHYKRPIFYTKVSKGIVCLCKCYILQIIS